MMESSNRPVTNATEAFVTISVDVADQVLLTMKGDQHDMVLKAARDSGCELVGSVFLPRHCKVTVEFPCIENRASDGSVSASATSLSGVVRRVQMIDAEPSYAIWVHADPGHDSQLVALRQVLGG